MAARTRDALEAQADRIRQTYPVKVVALPTDVEQLSQIDVLVDAVNQKLGPIDILVNNAALERAEVFTDAPFQLIERDLNVNVRAVMYLTQKCLPGMMERKLGHIVNIASLAGLGGYPHGESYTATKHAVVGFTRSLRASLIAGQSPVGATCICPGYVSDVGMFARKVEAYDVRAPAILGASSPQKIADAVVAGILKNQPEVIVNPKPIRPFLALTLLFPRLGEWLRTKLGVDAVSETAADNPIRALAPHEHEDS